MIDNDKYYRLLSMTENRHGDWGCLNKEDIEAIKYAIAQIDRSASEVNVEAMVKPDNGDQIPKPEWKTLLTWLVDKIAIEDKPKLSKGSAVTMIKYLEDLISKC